MVSTLTRVNCCSALLIRESQIILALQATTPCLLALLGRGSSVAQTSQCKTQLDWAELFDVRYYEKTKGVIMNQRSVVSKMYFKHKKYLR